MEVVQYSPEIDHRIRNLAALPRGLKAPYLLCLISHERTWIAQQWKREPPPNPKDGEVLICFGKGAFDKAVRFYKKTGRMI